MEVEWTFPETKWRNKCCFIPSQGWVLSYFEMYNETGTLVGRFETTEFGTSNGIWYPKRGKQSTEFDRRGKPGSVQEFTVTAIEFQASRIPERLFRVDFPKDAVIYDADLGVPVRLSEAAQTHLDEVIRRISPPRTNWWLWGSLLSCAVFLALGGLYWYRRKVTRGAN